jgi:hypothetical protein
MSENEEQSVPDWVVSTPAEQRALDAQRPNKRPKYGGQKKGTPNKRTLEKLHAAANDVIASQDGRQFNRRKAGSLNKRTIEKLRAAEHELAAGRAAKKLAVDHMDDMVEYLKSLVDLLGPWNADGTRREGGDENLWFRAVAVFQNFLALRAPYQSPRLGAVTIVPSAAQPDMREIPPEELDRRLAERGLPLSVFGMDKPVLELEALNGSEHVNGNDHDA